MRTFKRGDLVHCKYLDWEFDGVYIDQSHIYHSHLIEVTLGTGHQREGQLHSGDGTLTGNRGWYVEGYNISLLEIQYDPSQQGDKEEDI